MHWLFLASELSCSESAYCLACLVSSRKDSHDQKRERESEPSPPPEGVPGVTELPS